MVAWDQPGVRGRLASTLESVCRTELADNDRRGLQPDARNRIQQRTLVVQVGTVADVLLDLLFESIDLLFNLLEQVFVCFSNRLVFGFVKAVFRSSLLLLQRSFFSACRARVSSRRRLSSPVVPTSRWRQSLQFSLHVLTAPSTQNLYSDSAQMVLDAHTERRPLEGCLHSSVRSTPPTALARRRKRR